MSTGGMVSLVITFSFISLSVTPLLTAASSPVYRQTSMELLPHPQSLPRKLGPVVWTTPITPTWTSNGDEEHRRDMNVDPTGESHLGLHPGDRDASRGEEAMMARRRTMKKMMATLHEQAGKDNERREWRMTTTMTEDESSRSNDNLGGRGHQRHYDYRYYFTMDYLGVRRRRPIHNKSLPSSLSSRSAIPPQKNLQHPLRP